MAIGYQKFSVESTRYLYDTSTNAIVKISDVVYRIIDDFLAYDSDYILDNYAEMTPLEELRDAIEWLDNATTSRHMLQPYYHKDFTVILYRPFIESALESGMRQMALNITDQCNLRCSYCIYSGSYFSERTYGDCKMTCDIARRSIDYFLNHRDTGHKGNIAFYGGEPLLEWHLVRKCIKYIRGRCDPEELTINIITNGTLLNKDIMQFLVDFDTGLFISLDGPKDIHDECRCYHSGVGTYDHIIENITEIKDDYPEYYENRVVFNGTFHMKNDILALVEFFSKGLFSNASVQLNAIKTTDTNAGIVTEKNRTDHQERLAVLLNRYLASLQSGNDFPYGIIQYVFSDVFAKLATRDVGFSDASSAPRGLCVPGAQRLFVSSDGTFHVCEKFCPPGYDIGNYRSGIDIEKVCNLLEQVVAMSEELCQECWAYRLCSQCFIHVLDRGGISIGQKRRSCVKTRQKLLKSLERFVYLWEHERPGAEKNPDTLHAHVVKKHD